MSVKIRYLTAMCVLLGWLSGHTQDTASVDERMRAFALQPANALMADIYTNPANMLIYNTFCLTTITANGERDSQSQAVVCGLGDGYKGLGVNIDSYVTMEDARAWGHAAYSNYTRTAVGWNKSTDYWLVYPYLTADTVAGDMKGEKYQFSGGYAMAKGLWQFGATFGFESTMEYRDTDPRPRNIANNLTVSLGVGRKVGRYAIGMNALVSRYKQTGSIKYFHPLGGNKAYHLTGLGQSYFRFDGSRLDSYYGGTSYGVGLQAVPDGKRGLFGCIAIEGRNLVKRLPTTANLPIAEKHTRAARLSLGYNGCDRGIGVEARVCDDQGVERIYGDQSGDAYPLISKANQWSMGAAMACLSGYRAWHVRDIDFLLTPRCGWTRVEESSHLPAAKRLAQSCFARLTIEMTYAKGRNLLVACLSPYLVHGLSSRYDAVPAVNDYAQRIENHNFEMLKGDYSGVDFDISHSICCNRKMAITYGLKVGLCKTPLEGVCRSCRIYFGINI